MKLKYLYLLSILIFMLPSCYKDTEIFIPNQAYNINNEWLLSSLVGAPESFIVDLNNDPDVALPGGILLEWPDNKVRDIDGNLITGTVKIEFKEYTQPRVGLINCPESKSNNQWINSDKMITLKISKGNQPILLNEPAILYIPASEKKEETSVYNLIKEGSNTQWALSPKSTDDLEFGNWLIKGTNTPLKEVTGYRLQTMPGQDWIMIGRPLGNKIGLEVKCSATLPTGFDKRNAMAFFVADQNNIVFRMDYDAVKNQFFTDRGVTGHNIQGKVVFIGQKSEDDYYFGMTNVVLGADTSLNLIGTKMSLDNIKAAIIKL